MRLYLDNRHRWHLPIEEVARRFLCSEYAEETEEPIGWRLTAFIVNNLNSTWDSSVAFDRVEELVVAALRHPARS